MVGCAFTQAAGRSPAQSDMLTPGLVHGWALLTVGMDMLIVRP